MSIHETCISGLLDGGLSAEQAASFAEGLRQQPVLVASLRKELLLSDFMSRELNPARADEQFLSQLSVMLDNVSGSDFEDGDGPQDTTGPRPASPGGIGGMMKALIWSGVLGTTLVAGAYFLKVREKPQAAPPPVTLNIRKVAVTEFRRSGRMHWIEVVTTTSNSVLDVNATSEKLTNGSGGKASTSSTSSQSEALPTSAAESAISTNYSYTFIRHTAGGGGIAANMTVIDEYVALSDTTIHRCGQTNNVPDAKPILVLHTSAGKQYRCGVILDFPIDRSPEKITRAELYLYPDRVERDMPPVNILQATPSPPPNKTINDIAIPSPSAEPVATWQPINGQLNVIDVTDAVKAAAENKRISFFLEIPGSHMKERQTVIMSREHVEKIQKSGLVAQNDIRRPRLRLEMVPSETEEILYARSKESIKALKKKK